MRRPLAGEATIVRRTDQSLAEVMLPQGVDPDAGRERIARIDDPLGQLKAARRRLRPLRRSLQRTVKDRQQRQLPRLHDRTRTRRVPLLQQLQWWYVGAAI